MGNYLDAPDATAGESPEERVMALLSSKVCSRTYLNSLPNPMQYALHIPTVKWECEDFVENHGENLVDAFSLGEDPAAFCWDGDFCGSSDAALFDFQPEDDDD